MNRRDLHISEDQGDRGQETGEARSRSDPFRSFSGRRDFDIATLVIGAAIFGLGCGIVWICCWLFTTIQVK